MKMLLVQKRLCYVFICVFSKTACAVGVMLLYVCCFVYSCLLFQLAHKHSCIDFAIKPFAALFPLCVFPPLCSSFFPPLFKQWVFLPVDYHTFMQPDTRSCFILDTAPPTPSSSPKPLFRSSSVCTLPTGSWGKSTNMLNRV